MLYTWINNRNPSYRRHHTHERSMWRQLFKTLFYNAFKKSRFNDVVVLLQERWATPETCRCWFARNADITGTRARHVTTCGGVVIRSRVAPAQTVERRRRRRITTKSFCRQLLGTRQVSARADGAFELVGLFICAVGARPAGFLLSRLPRHAQSHN